MAKLHVELVSPEREVWAGDADGVYTRTLEGELGILPGHTPLFGALVDGGTVRIVGADTGSDVVAAVQDGFLSVANNRVSVLAEWAQLGSEVDVEKARASLAEAEAARPGAEQAAKEANRARAQLRAAGQEV